MSADAQLESLGIELPPAPKPVANYVTSLKVDQQLFISGHGPLLSDGSLITGRLGDDMDVDAGYAAARQTGLAILATLRERLGSLDKVERVIKVLGMVNSTADFADHPKVINGCSDLFVEVFGEERGRASRSAVGMGSLPGKIAVEIEALVLLKKD